MCPDDAPDTYSFIGQPPTPRRFDYVQSWQQIEDFFVKNGHSVIPRYPVVCRWRDDLYFTIASIVDFQRVMGSKVTFEFPANPLVVPQTCLRFLDLENVGITGRHFSSFCMVGQHSISNSEGYWKDKCVDLDFRLLTEQFGIQKDQVVFVEDVWSGGGSFGSSLEYFVGGLELGNAVFTEFQGDLSCHTTLDQKIIDMGAGLERFAWITMGTPTAYDCCFGPITQILLDGVGVDSNSPIISEYFTEIARALEAFDDLNDVRRHAVKRTGLTDSQTERIITPLEGAYLIADHLRTLIFAITDGALPSNVGGGYNLRMILRRIIGTADRLGLKLDMNRLVDAHVDYLIGTYPELDSGRNDVKTILDIESRRYEDSKAHMRSKADRIRQKGTPDVDDLITLYESDGITPDYLREINAISEVPSEFYSRLTELHQSARKKNTTVIPSEGLPATDVLFYEDDPMEFDAQVLEVFEDGVILDRTSFYARGGGQEPDHGTIDGFDVVDVSKHADIIVHKLRGGVPDKGSTVSCVVDSKRRLAISMNHTSTHILNASSRQILGSWIWQHSAFKEADHARLDITHHSPLTKSQITQIEDTANDIIRENLPVTVQYLERGVAEQRYGFRIYQGGVVPVKSVRIVSIADRDIEACGGMHVPNTGDIGLIKITKTKRIQDGVVRLEFTSGDAARRHAKSCQAALQKQKQIDAERQNVVIKRQEKKDYARRLLPEILSRVLSGESGIVEGIHVDDMRCFTSSDNYDEYFHIHFGRKLTMREEHSVYCGMFDVSGTVRVIVYCGKQSSKNAGDIARRISAVLGGSGGGDALFAQGGGRAMSKKDQAIKEAKSLVLG